jgi:hypothetical protein
MQIKVLRFTVHNAASVYGLRVDVSYIGCSVVSK